MSFFGKPKTIRTDEILVDPGLKPDDDPIFDQLFDQAMKGIIPVYFAAVPIGLCIPADPDYRPDMHPVGAAAINAAWDRAVQGKFSNLVVYPRGIWFVVSDDYIPLFASLRGMPDYVPCWVLGKPENALIKDVQGPIAVGDLRQALGLG